MRPADYKRCQAKQVALAGEAERVHPKVLDLLQHVRAGYAIAGVEERPQGGVRIRLRRGPRSMAVSFEHFEVPGLLQECGGVGVAK